MSDHHEGPRGVAHRVPDDRLKAEGDAPATIAYWWIHTPNPEMIVAHAGNEPADVQAIEVLEVHPIPKGMDTFALGLITLADVPGVPPAKKTFPWVTHELIVHTLDTTKKAVAHTDPLLWPLMQPHNLSVQFEVHDDDQARDVVGMIAKAIVEGMLPAEVQAYVPGHKKMMTLAPLYQVWQDTVAATAEHSRTGGTHDEDPRGR